MAESSEKANIGMAYARLVEALQKPKYTPGRIKKNAYQDKQNGETIILYKCFTGRE